LSKAPQLLECLGTRGPVRTVGLEDTVRSVCVLLKRFRITIRQSLSQAAPERNECTAGFGIFDGLLNNQSSLEPC
jgi:hypothetical protein